MQAHPSDVHRSFVDAPWRRLRAELYCLWLSFRPHPDNHNGRKAATLTVIGVWAAVEVGAAFGVAALPDQFFFLRVVVGVLIGRMWGIEINNFAGVEFVYTDDDDK
jgi:hypothetical protein